jgi:hypothetical protein
VNNQCGDSLMENGWNQPDGGVSNRPHRSNFKKENELWTRMQSSTD